MFAVNRRLCCRGLTALVNWLVFRNQYNPIAGPDGLTTQIRKEQKRSGFADHLHTRWSRVKNHENHAHLTKPPPFNVAVPSRGGSVWNTAFIERLNATKRERLTRRTAKSRHPRCRSAARVTRLKCGGAHQQWRLLHDPFRTG